MFFTPKVETVGGIKDFLSAGTCKKLKIGTALTGIGVGTAAAFFSHPTQTAVTVMATPVIGIGTIGIGDKIIRAFDPVISLLQGLSYPVSFIMVCAGFLVLMTGNRQKGLSMIKWAAIGYIGMQFAPALMAILIEVGKAMGK